MTKLKDLKNLIKIVNELKKPLSLATIFGALGHLSVVFFTLFLTLAFLEKGLTIYIFLILAFVLSFFKGFFAYVEQLLNHYVAFKVLHILRIKVIEKLKKVSLKNFFKNNSGDYMTMITTDIEILEVFYAHTITPFFIFLIQTVVISIFIGIFSIKLALITFVIYLIIGIAYPLLFKEKGQIYGDNYRKEVKNLANDSSEEAYSIFEAIQYQKIQEVKRKIEKRVENFIKASYKKEHFRFNLEFLNILTYNISVILFIYFANIYIENKSIVVALTAMYIVSFVPIIYMGNIASTLSQTMAAGKRFLNLMAEEEERENNKKVEFNKLEVKDLSFDYGKENIIKNINFSVEKGEILGISGASGNGKSTLAKLIMRILSYSKGSIKIDRVDINDINIRYFRENTSMIMQESYMYKATIEKNISIFEKKIDKEKIKDTLEKTNLLKFVNTLDKKEQERIEEKSTNISSGQRQRLSTSRSIYAKSKLIILDEATSNIDIFSEIELLKTLKEIKKDKIIIIISHNKSTLSICDKILKM